MKYTPGPWTYSRVIGNNGVLDIEDRKNEFCICSVYQDGIPKIQQVANAKLIAAAPDLLEACKAASGALSLQYSMDGQFSRWQDEALYVMLNNAIRKATE
jgi:hypothetical protein